MGTSGNRKGYKIFNISTTIRNPSRNYYFLKILEPYDGCENSEDNMKLIYFDFIGEGIYKSLNVSQVIKDKWDNNESLTKTEINEIIKNNPQLTGIKGRVMTHLRALRNQALLYFEDLNKRNKIKIHITEFGKQLLTNPEYAQTIYSKIMLSMHAKSPCRETLLNESLPFLNTIYVISKVNKEWQKLGNESKGILMHEFGAFVLSMKDCDYQTTANEIISYRKKFKYEVNKAYIENYLKSKNILPSNFDTIVRDYPDEVFRKFEMTGLLCKHGKFGYVYINFSKYNKEKVETILETYKSYSFKNFNSKEDYLKFQNVTLIPRETDNKVRLQIINGKANVLSVDLKKLSHLSLAEQEQQLDSLFYNKALENKILNTNLDIIYKELLILSGTLKNANSYYENIQDSLRLEYLLALLLGKLYGVSGLVSNIIYNEEGLPLHCAKGGICDISYHHQEGSFIFEPTMIKNRLQLINNETTNIVRHIKDEEKKTGIRHSAFLIAPRIHSDVVDYFKYKAITDTAKILPLKIDKFLDLLDRSKTIAELNANFDRELALFLTTDSYDYANLVNLFEYKI